MTPEELADPEARRDVLLRASGSVPEDAAPRITLSEGRDGATRIDVADTAAVRPGPPQLDAEVGEDEAPEDESAGDESAGTTAG